MASRKMKLDRHFVADRTVWAYLIIVSTPRLAFSPRSAEAQKPVCVQTFSPELAVQGFNEGIVCRLSWSREVESDASHVGPQIKFPADELRAIVNADGFWRSKVRGRLFESFDDIATAIGSPNVDGWRMPGKRIHDRQDPQFATVEKLIVHKVHRPEFVGLRRDRTITAQLCLHSVLWRFITQLQAHLTVQPIYTLGIDCPPFATKQDVNPSVTVTHPRLGNLSNACHELSLSGPL